MFSFTDPRILFGVLAFVIAAGAVALFLVAGTRAAVTTPHTRQVRR